MPVITATQEAEIEDTHKHTHTYILPKKFHICFLLIVQGAYNSISSYESSRIIHYGLNLKEI
jgi:hypothetical protein